MKLRDKIRLSLIEFHHDKKEWITSVILHILVFACVLFLSTISVDIDSVIYGYVDQYNPDGYACRMSGYLEGDVKELENMGFYDFCIDDGVVESGSIDSIDNAWQYKIKSIMDGKDLYFFEVEDDLNVLLFIKVVFLALSIVLFVLMCGNIINALAIKISKREEYIKMLMGLGMSKRDCGNIYVRFFLARNIFALLIASLLNVWVVMGINRYLIKAMKFKALFSAFNPALILVIFFLCVSFMMIIIKRQWRSRYE